ncbi:TetR/AcrR family transcriptional regulator [Paenibacillus sp. NEAU-GSW1]|uniref:TetR/AcrR family transcriptional regulator n=1 Tax=Paenibacillus sp. NEAU-GSW1 TaxID=2682486 RepID=UPI0012E18F1B|nr:TetR/AcrR family transcriptional regulator [Paenibacillus sp. NEAU-GSW1]MUT68827.1 TetR family transcriptional regulator [Paenibacillus sp. NEAU-GSW1]
MSPRTRQQNEQLREERRRQLLQAAVTLFVQDGFDKTSTAAIAKAAGVSHGTVFFYFQTKEELYRDAVLEPLGPALELVRETLTGSGSPRERVECLARLMLTSFAQEEAYLMLIRQVSHLKDRFTALYEELTAFTTGNKELLSSVIAEGQKAGQFLPGNPKKLAFFFLAFINGCSMMHPTEPGDIVLDDAVRAALHLIARP